MRETYRLNLLLYVLFNHQTENKHKYIHVFFIALEPIAYVKGYLVYGPHELILVIKNYPYV
jgi:hypothetical protein